VHLGDSQLLCDLRLGEVVIEAEINDSLLALREALNGFLDDDPVVSEEEVGVLV
jgi:hypothetical protein